MDGGKLPRRMFFRKIDLNVTCFWDTETFQNQLRDIISLACPGSTLGWNLKHLPRRHPSQMPKPP